MCVRSVLSVFCLLVITVSAGRIVYQNGAYDGLVFKIENYIPSSGCKDIIKNLEVAVKSASTSLYTALDGKARLGAVTVLLPSTWDDSCVSSKVSVSQGESFDVKVGLPHPAYKDAIWTQQSRGCGQSGDFISMSYRSLQEPKDLGRTLAREFVKYRYGVFDEVGYLNDPVYPICYSSEPRPPQITGCSDQPIQSVGICSNDVAVNTSNLVHPQAQASLMFANEAKHVTKFCSKDNHNRFAPTKQNLLCNRLSVEDVIMQHPDFSNSTSQQIISNATPTIVYKKETLTRYVVVIADTKDMQIRETWSYLRLAIRKWAVHDLPANTEVAVVTANESSAHRLRELSPLQTTNERDLVASNIPYTPGDSSAPACLSCGLKEATKILENRTNTVGPANSVIVLIAPGMSPDSVNSVNDVVNRAVNHKIRIATITYPEMYRSKSLDWLAHRTGGVAFTVSERKQNMESSNILTYFKLTNVMFNLVETFYQGNKADLPIEIHRRELHDDDDSRTSVSGSFYLEEFMTEPARFTILTHNTENPLIRSMTLTSPSSKIYSTRSDSLLSLRLLSVPANLTETGPWTYTIEKYFGNPQPNIVQVMATPWSRSAPIVRAKLWTSETLNPFVLYTEVKYGEWPVINARVEVTVTRPGVNGSSTHIERFELLDTGSGDPDLMKHDGIYSRYFTPAVGGPGVYTFEVTVSDNNNNAYTWDQNMDTRSSAKHPIILAPNCCGSKMKPPTKEKALTSFQRFLPPLTVTFNSDSMISVASAGRIGDLKVQLIPDDISALLTWTSPDMGGSPVARYEVRYANSVEDIVDRFDTATPWAYSSPFPLAPGSDSTLTLNMTKNPSLMGQVLYVAIRGFKDLSTDAMPGPVSNWVRILIPFAPTTTTQSPYAISSADSSSILENQSVIPKIAEFEFNLEIILAVAGGICLLALFLAISCYHCLIKRKKINEKKSPKNSKNEKQINVSVVPTSNGMSNGMSNGNVSISSPILSSTMSNDLHSQTLPSHFEPCLIDSDDSKKRYSIAQYTDSPYQHQQDLHIGNGLMNQVSNHLPNGQQYIMSNNNGTLVRGRTLSPYQSWTASQLLLEHERRHSPYGQVGEDQYAPPVPPLPSFNQQQESIYGNNVDNHNTGLPPPGQYSNNYHRTPNGNLMLFNPSLQGSLSSVSSGDKKKRNVTMV